MSAVARRYLEFSLRMEQQVALTLRLLGDLSMDEVARSFLVSEAAMMKRLVRAKYKIKAASIFLAWRLIDRGPTWQFLTNGPTYGTTIDVCCWPTLPAERVLMIENAQ